MSYPFYLEINFGCMSLVFFAHIKISFILHDSPETIQSYFNLINQS